MMWAEDAGASTAAPASGCRAAAAERVPAMVVINARDCAAWRRCGQAASSTPLFADAAARSTRGHNVVTRTMSVTDKNHHMRLPPLRRGRWQR
eukprot:scaffold2879_cov269-Prasinococcus_capsulatus_cf.AAC.22